MRKQLVTVCILLVGLTSPLLAEDFKTPVGKIELKAGETLVFLGDSITHQCLYTQYIEDFFYTRYPKQRIRFHNSGVGGDRAADALIRFDADVAAYKPKYVTVLLGMNDGSYRPFDQGTFDTYEQDMIKVVEEIRRIGAVPVLMTPTMYDARAARIANRGSEPMRTYYNAVLAYYGARLRELAMVEGLGFVDMYSPLNNLTGAARTEDASFTMIRDAVHPGSAGQVVMAAAILNDMHANRQVFSIHVTVRPSGDAKISVSGGTAVMIEGSAQRLAFSVLAEALPWVLPADAELGYQLTKAGHRLSRESLRISGLQPGSYQLCIAGKPVGHYSDLQLGRGIELQANPNTPQYQQALAVAQLNQQRNDEAMRPLRNLWRDKKMQRRAAAALKANPDDAKAKAQLDRYNKKLEKFDEQLAALQVKINEFDDKIYEANQPQELRYELAPKTSKP